MFLRERAQETYPWRPGDEEIDRQARCLFYARALEGWIQNTQAQFARDLQRQWYSRLRVHAHRLALGRITSLGVIECRECHAEPQPGSERITHFDGCSVGQVLHCLEQITDEDAMSRSRFAVREEHDLAALLIEAHALAWMQITTVIPRVPGCNECCQSLSEDALRGHTPECRTGKVLGRLAVLSAAGDVAREKVSGPAPGAKASLPGAAFSAEAATATEEVSASDNADGEPCAVCGHACLSHDDEFGNCMALPNPYGMRQRDGCDCSGYRTAEEKASE